MPKPEPIYEPITAMGFSAMFTFQLDNTKRQTLPAPHCRNGSCRYVRYLSHQSRDQKMLNLLSICKDTTMRQERILIGVLNTKLLILEIIGPTLEFVFFFSNRDGKLWGILVLQTTKQQCTKKLLFFTRVSLMSWD